MTQIALWFACLLALFAGGNYYRKPNTQLTQITGVAALVVHTVALVQLLAFQDGFNFLTIGLLIALIGNLVLWVSNRDKDLSLLLAIAFPAAAIVMAANALSPDSLILLHSPSLGTSLHILIASVAYSLFTAACGVGVLLAIQEYQLKHHNLRQLLRVPSLQVLERLMFEFIWAAFILLTITIGTGFYFIEDMFAQHLVHKTFFTLASWLVFAGLLLGHHLLGWRGKLAVKITIGGFVLLMLGYFGSKIVLEFLIGAV